MAHYLDASALAKLVVAEAETAALRAWLQASDRNPVSCDLTRTELMRAVRRADHDPRYAVQARAILNAMALTKVTTAIFDSAGRLNPPGLRPLDAIHLACALDLGDDLESIVTYDERLAQAALASGVPVTSPS